ncbi:MAG: anthranilate synthase, component [Bacteroidetes bacterium]|nr:anthranilate synthase, component [Bacteroidota bacterium]
MVLLIDNYDSFTYMLRDYIMQAGQECIVVRNDEKTMEEINSLDFDSIVISPGPRTPSEAGITMDVIRQYWEDKPILGICLGHQAIGEFFGSSLVSALKPMHGKTSIMKHTDHKIFEGIAAETEIMRYHSLALEYVLEDHLKVIADTAEGEIMGIAHTEKKIIGLQFHPESVLTPYGLQMIKNWYNYISR